MSTSKQTPDFDKIALDLWKGMRQVMGKPDGITATTPGPVEGPLSDALVRYARLLAKGGVFGGSPELGEREGSVCVPTRPGTLLARSANQGKKDDKPKDASKAESVLGFEKLFDGDEIDFIPNDVGDDFFDEDGDSASTADPSPEVPARPPVPQIHPKVSDPNKELIKKGWPDMRPQGIADVDTLDESIAAVHDKYPWMQEATLSVWKRLRRQILDDGRISHFGALLLAGPPGIGKTSWARDLAKVLQVGKGVNIDAGTSPAGFTLSGLEIGWGNAFPGEVVRTMLMEEITNPLVIVDEIDKACVATSTKGQSHSIANILLGMMGPASKDWNCPYFTANFDMSDVSWVLTANECHEIPSPLLSRCEVIQVPFPKVEQVLGMVSKITHIPEAAEIVRADVSRRFAREDPVSPRLAERLVQVALDGLAMPETSA